MKRILVVGKSQYRLTEPYSKLSCDGIEFVLSTGETRLFDALDYDGFIINQPTIDISEDFIKDYKGKGKVFVVDVDDDLTALPYMNPVYHEMREEDRLRYYKNSLRLCDYIHVSTPELKESLRYQKKTEVFLNGIDFSKYTADKTEIKNNFRRTFKIPAENKIVSWFGSHTHQDDLALVFPLIRELLNRTDVTVVLCSHLKWLQMIGFRSDYFKNLVTLDYLPFDMYCNTLSVADVSLVPLVDNKFNRQKSELKILESAVWEIPCVVSNVAPYKRFQNCSSTDHVLMVQKERLNLWLEQIDLALGVVGTVVGKNSRKVAEHNYDLNNINEERKLWWKSMLT